jgi:hypothetical protein
LVRVARDGSVGDAAIKQVNLRIIGSEMQMGLYRQRFANAAMQAVRKWTSASPVAGVLATKPALDRAGTGGLPVRESARLRKMRGLHPRRARRPQNGRMRRARLRSSCRQAISQSPRSRWFDDATRTGSADPDGMRERNVDNLMRTLNVIPPVVANRRSIV